MEQHFLKNIEFSKAIDLGSLVDYQQGQVVSRTLVQGKAVSITLFAFDKGEEISTHASKGDAMVFLLDGEAEITIGEVKYAVKKDQTIIMSADIPHALQAVERFKMILTVVFSAN